MCSFSDGRFHSSTHRAKLVEVEEALIESQLEAETAMNLFKVIAEIVHSAEKLKHGCTLVVDLNEQPVEISGQRLEPPLDLTDPHLLALARAKPAIARKLADFYRLFRRRLAEQTTVSTGSPLGWRVSDAAGRRSAVGPVQGADGLHPGPTRNHWR